MRQRVNGTPSNPIHNIRAKRADIGQITRVIGSGPVPSRRTSIRAAGREAGVDDHDRNRRKLFARAECGLPRGRRQSTVCPLVFALLLVAPKTLWQLAAEQRARRLAAWAQNLSLIGDRPQNEGTSPRRTAPRSRQPVNADVERQSSPLALQLRWLGCTEYSPWFISWGDPLARMPACRTGKTRGRIAPSSGAGDAQEETNG
jgi:hypothetical protein